MCDKAVNDSDSYLWAGHAFIIWNRMPIGPKKIRIVNSPRKNYSKQKIKDSNLLFFCLLLPPLLSFFSFLTADVVCKKEKEKKKRKRRREGKTGQ